MELKKQYQFLYATVAIDTAVKNGGEQIGFEMYYNMFNCPALLSETDCVFVNSTIIKIIGIRQFKTNKDNILYYNIKLRQFALIEEGQIVDNKKLLKEYSELAQTQ